MCSSKPANNFFLFIPVFCFHSRQFLFFLSLDFRRDEVCIARTGGGARMGPYKARRSLAAASRAGQTGSILIRLALFIGTVIVILFFMSLIVITFAGSGSVFEPIAAASNSNDLGMMKEPVQDCRS